MGEFVVISCRVCGQMIDEVWCDEIDKRINIVTEIKEDACNCIANMISDEGYDDGYKAEKKEAPDAN